ncbi:hypothetical protein Syun_019576 [Stephania yunnanensis]|uniref:Uncharacterized protein n=1 Tax=Stephania yunnanensis TaxID=152371 RepID=A0AAP0NXK2_9MAGN
MEKPRGGAVGAAEEGCRRFRVADHYHRSRVATMERCHRGEEGPPLLERWFALDSECAMIENRIRGESRAVSHHATYVNRNNDVVALREGRASMAALDEPTIGLMGITRWHIRPVVLELSDYLFGLGLGIGLGWRSRPGDLTLGQKKVQKDIRSTDVSQSSVERQIKLPNQQLNSPRDESSYCLKEGGRQRWGSKKRLEMYLLNK